MVRAEASETCWVANGADGQLETVDRVRQPDAGLGRDGRGQRRVGGQCGVHRYRVGVQVEQTAAAGHRGGQVTHVGQPQRRVDVAVGRGQRHRGGPVRQSQPSVVGAVADHLDAG